jgi:hypothetical protein
MSAAGEHPSISSEWPKNSRGEIIRVSLDEFKGKPTLDLCAWYTAESGETKPTRSGLTIAIKHLPQIAGGVAAALAEANRRGPLAPETGEPPAADEVVP